MVLQPRGHALQKMPGRFHAVRKRFEHVRLRGESEGSPQGSIPCAVARRLEEAHDPVVGRLSPAIHVGNHRHPSFGHGCVQRRRQRVSNEWPQHGSCLVWLGLDERHRVGIVRAVGRVGVDEDVGIDCMERLHKREGVAAVHLHKITVEVEVLGIASESIGLWSILVGPGAAVSSGCTAHVVLRDDHPGRCTQGVAWTIRQTKPIGGHGKACIHPAWLPRVDRVVDQNHGLATILRHAGTQRSQVAHRRLWTCWRGGQDKGVDGTPHVAATHRMKRGTGIRRSQPFHVAQSFLVTGRRVRCHQRIDLPQGRFARDSTGSARIRMAAGQQQPCA